MLHTALTELLQIPHPILQGGMAWVATSRLVIAVSEAGGLGILGAGNAPVEWVRSNIEQIQAGTTRPFGVNVPLFSPFTLDVVQLCVQHRVPVMTFGAGDASPFVRLLKEQAPDISAIPLVASVALARRLQKAGADAVVAEGVESGGHVGTVSTMSLVPQVVDALTIPVIAAGGIADGRGLVAALALGASGVQMGTRFVCTDECAAHAHYKAAILRAGERSTMVTGTAVGHPVRCLRNPLARSIADLEKRGVSEEEVIAFGTGKYRLAAIEGDTVNGSVMVGQIGGLVHDVIPAAEVVRRTVQEAEAELDRLRGCLCT